MERGFDCLFCSLFSEVRRREVKHLAELIHSWQRKTNRGARIDTIGGRSDTSDVRVLGEVQPDRGCVRQCAFLREAEAAMGRVRVRGAKQKRAH